MSYTHRIATCSLPLRSLRCRGFRHLARECMHSRSLEQRVAASGAGRQRRFVRAHPDPGSPGTQAASQANGPTTTDSPTTDEHDALQLGHLDLSSMEANCIIHRSSAINDAAMRQSFTALAEDAARALRSIQGGEERTVRYRILVHIKRTTDYDPQVPSPPPSPPEYDDGDSDHGGHLDGHQCAGGTRSSAAADT